MYLVQPRMNLMDLDGVNKQSKINSLLDHAVVGVLIKMQKGGDINMLSEVYHDITVSKTTVGNY